jgi:hypothetical protein
MGDASEVQFQNTCPMSHLYKGAPQDTCRLPPSAGRNRALWDHWCLLQAGQRCSCSSMGAPSRLLHELDKTPRSRTRPPPPWYQQYKAAQEQHLQHTNLAAVWRWWYAARSPSSCCWWHPNKGHCRQVLKHEKPPSQPSQTHTCTRTPAVLRHTARK